MNGHGFEKESPTNFWAIFATKDELRLTDQKVEELVKSDAVKTTMLETLTSSVEEISKDIKILVVNKGVYDGIKQFAMKCFIRTFSWVIMLVTPLFVAHAMGWTKIIGKWLNG